ncbi:hypothetical protein KPL70_014673 [Citrus sinensis]|nr:hypothetical protein KPL70_014673 [Citrus sinensis]
MEWTLISWAIGLILASPLFGLISKQLDHGYNPQLIARAATAIGSLFSIVALYIVASASHTRHLGLMVRGYTGPTLKRSQFPTRRGVSGWFSEYATAAGGLGSAIFSAFTYHMGLKWLVGMLHIVTLSQGQSPTQLPLCPNNIPYAVRMQLLGFLLPLLTSVTGFYSKEKNWQRHHVLLFAAIQSTSAGFLHAFGRVLLLDCTPHGKEGAFPVWHSWVKALGTCTGFAVASAISGNVSTAFGVSFLAATIGILIVIFGDISDVGGDMAAGHLHEASEKGSPVPGLDTSIIIKEHAHEEIA